MTDFGDLNILDPAATLPWMAAHPGNVHIDTPPASHPVKGKPPKTPAPKKGKLPKKGKAGSGGHKHSSGSHGGHGAHAQGHAGKGGHGKSSHSGKVRHHKVSPTDTLDPIAHMKMVMPWALDAQAALAYEQSWTPTLATHKGRHGKAVYADVAFPGRTTVGPGGQGHNAPRVGKHYADGSPVGRSARAPGHKHAGHPGHHAGNSHRGHHTRAKSAHQVHAGGFVMQSTKAGHPPSAPLHVPGPVRIHHGNHH